MMNQAQQQQLERAYLRAEKHGVHIVGTGTRKADGTRLFVVSSGSVENKTYFVVVSGAHLTCSCPAAEYGRLCQHRAVVHIRLLAEKQAERKAAEEKASRSSVEAESVGARTADRVVSRSEDEEQEEEEAPRYGLTAKGLAYVRQWRAEQAALAARETAIPRRSNKPFSLMK